MIKIISDGEERIFTYGAYGNLLQAQIFKDGEETQTENYTYNGLGELIRKSVASDAVNQTYSYTYSENYSRDLAVSGFGDFVFKPLKDACGRNIGKEIFNGENKIAGENIIYRKVGDHGTHMPLAVKFTDGTDIRYLYDRRGNISQITENGEVSARFVYDELNRLSKEENKVFGMTCKYVYDNNGNILYKLTETKDGQEKDVYEYVGDKLVSYNGETCVYDNLGNPVEYRNKTLVWEYGKRLVNYGGVTFTYNAFGKRTSKNGINFVYDNEGNLIAQSDGLQFIYDRTGVVGVIYGGETYLCRKDIQGNITALIDNKGKIAIGLIIALTLLGIGFVAGGTANAVKSYQSGSSGWKVAGDFFLGGSIGLATIGGILAIGGVFLGALNVTILGITGAQLFAVGAVAFNLVATIAAPIFGFVMSPINFEIPKWLPQPNLLPNLSHSVLKNKKEIKWETKIILTLLNLRETFLKKPEKFYLLNS